MKAAAEVAAEFGVLCTPRNMTNEEAALGLAVNAHRIRAMKTLQIARGISVALSEEDHGSDLLEAVGASKREQVRAAFSKLRQSGISRMEDKHGR